MRWQLRSGVVSLTLAVLDLVSLLSGQVFQPAKAAGEHQLSTSTAVWCQLIEKPISPWQPFLHEAAMKAFIKGHGATVYTRP